MKTVYFYPSHVHDPVYTASKKGAAVATVKYKATKKRPPEDFDDENFETNRGNVPIQYQPAVHLGLLHPGRGRGRPSPGQPTRRSGMGRTTCPCPRPSWSTLHQSSYLRYPPKTCKLGTARTWSKARPGAKVSKRGGCREGAWRDRLGKLKYGDLAWDSMPDQNVDKTPHCQVV